MTASPLIVSLPADLREEVLSQGPLPEGVEFVEWDLRTEPPVEHIDLVVPVYLGSNKPLANVAAVTPELVQVQSIGYDGLADLLPAGITLANAATVHEASTAELTVGLILASQRGIPDFVRAERTGEWLQSQRPSLADRRVLLIGYGGVGAAIEERLLPFEVELTRVASSAREDERGPIHGIDELPGLLPHAEIVIVVVPLTDGTRGLIGDDFLAALPDDALVVNVARGPVADTDALVEHATSGRIRLALDVTDPEPLPADHPLWSLPNVLVSPHIGGATSAMLPRMARLLRRQIEHLLADEEPENIVLRT
ncbi:Phosphoglycerate dehydrogenase [Plantibacter flavus]|uniref:Phosphoglycerate dehydrogenase-like enzyme n=1 Tax=Plantibacter flavus TaxID=150123 RepID=A0A3N2BYB1_9MICO|nr:2-hydroxyacid dehydrogenase [Plantibacter flavus]ROR80239.1 phosphoglycerate dehydrogenase-like enzyme [Plantibacter flavus]SMG50293.1 Phosphoglycerate dehydrogenase [Plantibacter flavus]